MGEIETWVWTKTNSGFQDNEVAFDSFKRIWERERGMGGRIEEEGRMGVMWNFIYKVLKIKKQTNSLIFDLVF